MSEAREARQKVGPREGEREGAGEGLEGGSRGGREGGLGGREPGSQGGSPGMEGRGGTISFWIPMDSIAKLDIQSNFGYP